jgi:5-hydroxyisourate hydrolase
MTTLSTHVLNTANGTPAQGLKITLKRLEPRLKDLGVFITNSDGRVSEKLLPENEALFGVYEITFHAGDYLRDLGLTLPEYPFLDIVPIRFGISEDAHYHVPLLLSPYGFSTYRGS